MHRALALAAAASLALPLSAEAGETVVEDALRRAVESVAATGELAQSFQALSVFGASPGISAATFRVSDQDLDINAYKISPSYAFDIGLDPVKPYVEGTIGYLDADQDGTFQLLADTPTAIDLDIHAFTFLGGIGAEIEIAEGTVIRPIALIGYSRVDDDAELFGPEADLLGGAGAGILFDVRIDSLLYGAALEIETVQTISDDIDLVAGVRYNHLVDHVLDASSRFLEDDNDFGVLTARAEVDGPIGVSVFERELRWIAFAGHSFLPGEKDDLGFSYFFELGGGVEIVSPGVLPWVEGVSLRASGIVGNGVTGFTAGASLEF